MRTVFGSLRVVIVALLWTCLFAVRAYAHGGIAGPDELGPPIMLSAALGVGGYWLMMLWPSRGRAAANGKKRKPMRSAMK
jgi:hypothetical protein